MKIFKSLEEYSLLIKVVSQTTYNKEKEQKVGFFGMLQGTLGVCLLGNLWTSKDTIKTGKGTVRAREVTNRAGQNL